MMAGKGGGVGLGGGVICPLNRPPPPPRCGTCETNLTILGWSPSAGKIWRSTEKLLAIRAVTLWYAALSFQTSKGYFRTTPGRTCKKCDVEPWKSRAGLHMISQVPGTE